MRPPAMKKLDHPYLALVILILPLIILLMVSRWIDHDNLIVDLDHIDNDDLTSRTHPAIEHDRHPNA